MAGCRSAHFHGHTSLEATADTRHCHRHASFEATADTDIAMDRQALKRLQTHEDTSFEAAADKDRDIHDICCPI